ncbi:Putative ribonuclease H protein At1g65750 [Linum perenne]
MRRLPELPEGTFTAGPVAPIWPLEASSRFSVRSLRGALTTNRFPRLLSFPHDVIWLNGVPPKVQAFCWLVCHSKIASLDNLQRRGFQLANRCALCYANLESINHLFLRCDFTMHLWNRISSTLSIFGPCGESVNDVFMGWKSMNCYPNFQGGTRFVLHAFIWFVWLERNDRIFNDKPSQEIQVFYRIMINVGRWMMAENICSADHLQSWNRLIFDPG